MVSIHENHGSDEPSGFFPDSYKAINRPIWQSISYGYFPRRFHDKKWIIGAPSWVFDERYDLVAKVDPEDVDAWEKIRKEGSAEDNPDLQAMFRKFLEERCALKVHRAHIEADGYDLVTSSKLKLTPGKAVGSTSPDVIAGADGGTMTLFQEDGGHGWKFNNESMGALLSFLAIFSGAPIRDRTNLTGRYDFILKVPDDQTAFSSAQANSVSDFISVQLSLRALGLELRPARVSIDAVVVDQIEKPTEN